MVALSGDVGTTEPVLPLKISDTTQAMERKIGTQVNGRAGVQSHDENEMVNNCHATSTLYAEKINEAAALSFSSVRA